MVNTNVAFIFRVEE